MGQDVGSQLDVPRALLHATCNHFHEMAPETIRENTFCCGGGGGLLTDELGELRTKGAQPRMRAMREVADEHGVTHVAAICAICKAQFSTILPQYGFDREGVVGVHQMVSNAIVLTGSIQAQDYEAKLARARSGDVAAGGNNNE
jgi:Fe-S oxidoreductase